jgi:hypothetical protein
MGLSACGNCFHVMAFYETHDRASCGCWSWFPLAQQSGSSVADERGASARFKLSHLAWHGTFSRTLRLVAAPKPNAPAKATACRISRMRHRLSVFPSRQSSPVTPTWRGTGEYEKETWPKSCHKLGHNALCWRLRCSTIQKNMYCNFRFRTARE